MAILTLNRAFNPPLLSSGYDKGTPRHSSSMCIHSIGIVNLHASSFFDARAKTIEEDHMVSFLAPSGERENLLNRFGHDLFQESVRVGCKG
jgi:hypothetical protein